MVTTLQQIADWIANLEAYRTQHKDTPFLRADMVVKEAGSNPRVDEWLTQLRRNGFRDLHAAFTELSDLPHVDRLRVLLALRSAGHWQGIVDFAGRVDERNRDRSFTLTPVVGQQVAMALNRIGTPTHSLLAEELLRKIMSEHDSDSESLGILGRVYKDRWLQHRYRDPKNGFLYGALEAYWKGMRSNTSEIYPAINVLTLLRVADCDPQTLSRFANYIKWLLDARVENERDYFDFATRVELYVVTPEFGKASEKMDDLLGAAEARWQLETTAQNLSLLPDTSDLVAHLRKEMNARWPVGTAA
jgi:hypothetical protein